MVISRPEILEKKKLEIPLEHFSEMEDMKIVKAIEVTPKVQTITLEVASCDVIESIEATIDNKEGINMHTITFSSVCTIFFCVRSSSPA